MLKIKYSSNFEDSYYKIIAKSKADKFNGLTFEQYYNKYYKKTLIYDLKDLLCGDFDKIVKIKDFHKTKYKDDNKIKKFFNYDKANSKDFIPLLSKLQPKISNFFQKNIEVHTCYYCNIDFINTYKKNNKRKRQFFCESR